jgi:hypothetical protein
MLAVSRNKNEEDTIWMRRTDADEKLLFVTLVGSEDTTVL